MRQGKKDCISISETSRKDNSMKTENMSTVAVGNE